MADMSDLDFNSDGSVQNSASSSSLDPSSLLGKAWEWLQTEEGLTGAASVIGGGLASYFGADKPDPTGYQGKIPNYQYNRQALPMNNDPNRRPGSAGRRYFTEGTYSGGGPNEGMPAPAINQPQGGGIAAVQPAPRVNTEERPALNLASGGIAQLKEGRYLRGETDGMADKIDTKIDGKDPAALSHGEFVIPADVVSHLGNGNSEAGAKILEQMMSRVRKDRTGKKEQGKEINPNNYLPV